MLPFFMTTIPLLNTIWLLYYSTSEKTMQSNYRQFLGVWVVLGTYYALSTLLSFVPFLSSFSGSNTQLVREVVVVVSICIQLSVSFTEIVLDILTPVRRLAAHVPALSLSTSNRVVAVLLYFLSPQHAHFLVSLFQDGVASLLASLFVFTPVPSVGVAIVCFLFPVAKSAVSVEHIISDDLLRGEATKKGTRSGKEADGQSLNDPTGESDVSGKNSASSSGALTSLALIAGATVAGGAGAWLQAGDKKESRRKAAAAELQSIRRERRRWLEYWVCIASLVLLDKFWMRVWPSVFMLMALWMQHSYFQGSTRIVTFVHEFIMVLRVRNERLRKELEAKALSANLAESSQESLLVASSESSSDSSATGSPVQAQAKQMNATLSSPRLSASPGATAGATVGATSGRENRVSREGARDDNESPTKVRKRVQKV